MPIGTGTIRHFNKGYVCMYVCKVLKANDQRDIVSFVSSACYLRRHWPECFGRVKRTFCFTGAIDILQGAVVRRPISA